MFITGSFHLTSSGIAVTVEVSTSNDISTQIFTCSRKLVISKNIDCSKLPIELNILIKSTSFTTM
jgi:hypothetical protein